jgi:hypothetical protein
MVDTRYVKKFHVKNKTLTASHNVYWITACYDTDGAELYGTTPAYATAYTTFNTAGVLATYFYQFSPSTQMITFHDDVKSAFIGIGNSDAYDDTFGIDILVDPCQYTPAVWTGYDGAQERPGYYLAAATPTKAVFWQGETIWNDAAAASGSPGWSCVFGFRTALNGGEPMGEVNMVVDSIAGVATGDIIGVALNTGLWHWTTVNGAPVGVTIVLTAALPSAAANNNIVHVTRWKAMANVAA